MAARRRAPVSSSTRLRSNYSERYCDALLTPLVTFLTVVLSSKPVILVSKSGQWRHAMKQYRAIALARALAFLAGGALAILSTAARAQSPSYYVTIYEGPNSNEVGMNGTDGAQVGYEILAQKSHALLWTGSKTPIDLHPAGFDASY